MYLVSDVTGPWKLVDPLSFLHLYQLVFDLLEWIVMGPHHVPVRANVVVPSFVPCTYTVYSTLEWYWCSSLSCTLYRNRTQYTIVVPV